MRLAGHVAGIGVLGPGLADWLSASAILAGERSYRTARTLVDTPALLPPAERRRAGRVVKLAISVAREATAHAGIDPAYLASVFASSGGDGENCHELCQALAIETREISPTRFANSVHNAAAGYWSIATHAELESNVICAFDASFGAGLLEALAQVTVDGVATLLVAYDTDYPEPIRSKRAVPDAFGVALVLTPERRANSISHIEAELKDERADTMRDEQLESMRRTIPAARSLPLLEQFARGGAGQVRLDYLDPTHLAVTVTPCR